MNIIERIKPLFAKESYMLDDGTLDMRLLVKRTILATIPILAIYLVAMKLLSLTPLGKSEMMKEFVQNLGVHGVALYVYIVDWFVLPISVDLIWPFVMSWPPLLVILVMGTSSVAGAWSAYLVGRLVGLIPPIKRWVLKVSGTHAEEIITKYGVWAIVISGLTPLPFSTICTVAGAVKFKLHLFLLGSLVRYLRMAIYYGIFAGLIYIS
ncbi:VTT domain-containing protein [Sphaerochaeta sp. PS]|jgi:membrane protein YqaA with SNARE-associated domain|uniref:YqaA family protein n=1 Tax=Sphaerochaeta sp. PS TaxID=3076336 RepID=UPI0028A385BC|nr:VTT domain-containing protein [Sphaerochaeta sp. PS]MDT4762557.1 VTT domain-containing protein [Sphaerochaeta sp. PS]